MAELVYLRGVIQGWKELVEIDNKSNRYEVYPDNVSENKGFLRGLEYAYDLVTLSEEEVKKKLNIE